MFRYFAQRYDRILSLSRSTVIFDPDEIYARVLPVKARHKDELEAVLNFIDTIFYSVTLGLIGSLLHFEGNLS